MKKEYAKIIENLKALAIEREEDEHEFDSIEWFEREEEKEDED